ncbi:MAG: hypothetical protein Q4D20_00405 [Clostridia bacterium]|nr:hypothetical protein [Clostridia bacterium]
MNDVLCLATGDTYDLVLKTKITAHPTTRAYPVADTLYLVPIRKGGVMEYLFFISDTLICEPDNIYSYANVLDETKYKRLVAYHEERRATFGYGKSAPYKFYFLELKAVIPQPCIKKYVRVSAKINLDALNL